MYDGTMASIHSAQSPPSTHKKARDSDWQILDFIKLEETYSTSITTSYDDG